ncbi:hypothetical protein B4N89_45850 [Embleya scabrispora]|uniref:HTH cro/C1-type domain-containing protein n=1 Tax=Embleya scabrispora TaxID=159449 RepID=A0A1T3NJL4_9ACTN|nr:hypothetical protein B4N89_45850 [Embleya scabrispora]
MFEDTTRLRLGADLPRHPSFEGPPGQRHPMQSRFTLAGGQRIPGQRELHIESGELTPPPNEHHLAKERVAHHRSSPFLARTRTLIYDGPPGSKPSTTGSRHAGPDRRSDRSSPAGWCDTVAPPKRPRLGPPEREPNSSPAGTPRRCSRTLHVPTGGRASKSPVSHPSNTPRETTTRRSRESRSARASVSRARANLASNVVKWLHRRSRTMLRKRVDLTAVHPPEHARPRVTGCQAPHAERDPARMLLHGSHSNTYRQIATGSCCRGTLAAATLTDMPHTKASPASIARIELGELIKQLRTLAGLTLTEAAHELGIDAPRLSRLENAEGQLRPALAERLFGLYQANDRDRAHVLALMEADAAAVAQQRRPKWWKGAADLLVPMGFDGFLKLERMANVLRNYEPRVIQGRLQTRAYAERVVTGSRLGIKPDEVKALVDVRMRRQRDVRDGEIRRFEALVEESTLRFPGVEPDVMREQIDALLTSSHDPLNTIRVLPIATGFHPGMTGPFMLMEFPNTQRRAVWAELERRSVFFESPADVDVYVEAFDDMWNNRALTPRRPATFSPTYSGSSRNDQALALRVRPRRPDLAQVRPQHPGKLPGAGPVRALGPPARRRGPEHTADRVDRGRDRLPVPKHQGRRVRPPDHLTAGNAAAGGRIQAPGFPTPVLRSGPDHRPRPASAPVSQPRPSRAVHVLRARGLPRVPGEGEDSCEPPACARWYWRTAGTPTRPSTRSSATPGTRSQAANANHAFTA